MSKAIIILIIVVAATFFGYRHFEQQKMAQQLQQQMLLQQQQEDAFKKAFNTWYSPPRGCDIPKSGPLRVSCIDDRIQKKNEFQKIWQQNSN